MIPVLLGRLLGLSFACGLNLYITVAALGILSRTGLIQPLPPGLRGLESMIVIGSALALYVVEAVVDKVRHADSLWDAVHTFIRPPAAALLAVGALWGHSAVAVTAGATLAFLVTLAAHGTKAGVRLALNAAAQPRGNAWISVMEDLAAILFAVAALQYPSTALATGTVVLLLVAIFGPRFWRAFLFGLRCVIAWIRALFAPPRWHEEAEIPRKLRRLLDERPLGSPPNRGMRVALHGLRGIGSYRAGWLVLTFDGPVFLYRALFRTRRVDLPPIRAVEVQRGTWANIVRVSAGDDEFSLYLLKDGPAPEAAAAELVVVPA